MIGDLTTRAPVVLLLDDVQWADPSSCEVLRHLARQLDDAPLLVVATARSVDLVEHDVATQVLFELEQDDLLTRLGVQPLEAPGLRALAQQVTGSPPPEVLVDWLDERSRGNALFAIGLLRALLEEGANLSAPVLRRLPEGLVQRVSARVRQVDAAQLATLELLAVAGRPVPLGELAVLTGRSPAELEPVLSELVATRGVAELEPVRADLLDELAGFGLASPELTIRIVDRLERHAETGKLKRFVPLAPR